MNAATPRRMPILRAECENGPRPCPHRGCRHYIGGGSETCSLDVAARGEHSQREVAGVLGVPWQVVDAIERIAFRRILRGEVCVVRRNECER